MMFSPRLLLLLIALPLLLLLEIQHLHLFTTDASLSVLSTWIPEVLQPSSRPRVKLPQGTILGSTIAENLKVPVEAFRGIPYAKAPVGERRFRRAEAVDDVSDEGEVVIDARRMGKRLATVFPGWELRGVEIDGADFAYSDAPVNN